MLMNFESSVPLKANAFECNDDRAVRSMYVAAETRGIGDSKMRLRNLVLYASSAFDFECQAL